MVVTLLGQEQLWKIAFCRSEFIHLLNKMASFAKVQSIEVYLVQDVMITFFNFHYMHCNGVTNILAFPMEEKVFAGSLIVSVDAVRRESFLYRQPLSTYCLSLLAHGFAHILGYNHGEKMDDFCKELVTFSRV